MFNVKLYTTFNLLLIVIFFFKIIYKQTIFFYFRLSMNMNSCEFKEIIVFKDFEIKNGMFGLERDIYLSIVQFLFVKYK
jgi:hypothetical protein